MSFEDLHDRAMDSMDQAEDLARQGLPAAARSKYEEAAQLEERAADRVPDDKPRSRGILRRGVVSLWQRAGRPDRVVEVAERYLGEPLLPGFAREIHELLNEARRKLAEAQVFPEEPEERLEGLLDAAREQERRLAHGQGLYAPVRGPKAA